MRYIFCIFCCLLLRSQLFSQTRQLSNSCFEIAFGISDDFYHHSLSNQSLAKDASLDSVYSYTFTKKPGIHLGMLKSFELSDKLLMRTGVTGSMSTADYTFTSDNKDNFQHRVRIKSRVLAFTIPLHLIYNIKLSKKKAPETYPYVLAGGFYSYQNQSSTAPLSNHSSTAIMLNSHQAGIDVGIGSRLFRTHKYLFAPELKYRIGLLNMKAPYNDPYNKLFDVLKMQSLILTIHFS